jgi:hypothetical protein
MKKLYLKRTQKGFERSRINKVKKIKKTDMMIHNMLQFLKHMKPGREMNI